MKHRLSLLCCTLLPVTPVMAQSETDITLTLSSAQRHDIDFATATHTVGAKAITPYGLVLCDYGQESGETRIDTFDDVFGTNSVLASAWNGYDAKRLQCGYGLKLPLLGGELSAGIGFMQQDGETDITADGKEIELGAISLKAKYERGDYSTSMTLLDSQYSFLYHYDVLPAPYDSDTSGHVRKLNIAGEWGTVYAELEDLTGSKDKSFIAPPMPLPDADITYHQSAASVGPRLSPAMGVLRYIAPTYVTGSERGSFNELHLNNGIRGAIAGLVFGEAQLRISYLDLESAGSRDYSPVTNDLAEEKHTTSLGLELESDNWSVRLENNRMTHHGYITVTDSPIPYTLMAGCPDASCSYDNNRREDEWKLSGSYEHSEELTLKAGLYQRERTDQQYEFSTHNYRESGGTLGLAITF